MKAALIISIALSLGSLFTAQASFAEAYYKWTKDDGSTTFTRTPPVDGRTFEKISTFVKTGGAETQNTASQEAEKPQEEAEKIGSATPYDKDPERCAAAKNNLKVMAEKSRIKIQSEDGEVRYLSPDEISQQKQQMQEIINLEC